MCTINHYSIYIMVENWQSSKCCKFVKNYFFSIKILHAHLQYVCKIPAKYKKDSLKSLGEVDFTNYAISVQLQTSYSKITKWHNSCNTDPSAPFFLQKMQCVMVKVWCKFDQNWLNTFKVTEQRCLNDDE